MKKVISLALSLLMALSVFYIIPTSVFAEDEEVTTFNCCEILEKYVNLDTLRDTVAGAVTKNQSHLLIDTSLISIPSEYSKALAYFISYYMPEYFNVDGVSTSSGSKIDTIIFTYSGEYSSTSFMQGAAELLDGIEGNDSLSDVEKALLVHDRLVARTYYDTAANTSERFTSDSKASAPIILGRARCAGYAKAYSYLMNRLGIKTKIVTSEVLDHAWNVIYLDGKAYFVDATWDDPAQDTVGYVSHDNFLRSAEGILETKHIKNDVIDYPLANCVNKEYDNYYWQNSTSEFQYINDKIYYLDNSAGTLNIADKEKTVLCTVDDSEFAKLSFLDNKLLFSDLTSVYQYDLESSVKCKIYSPNGSSFGNDFHISGFTFKNDSLYCYMYNKSGFDCPLSQRNQYLISVKYDSLTICENHYYVNNECPNCHRTQFEFTVSGGAATITKYNSIDIQATVEIPSTLNGYPVTKIGSKSFSSCADITELILPDSVTDIDTYAFEKCKNLKNIAFSEGLISIGDYAFSYCTALEEVDIPNSTEMILQYAFTGCTSLKSISIGSGLMALYRGVFAGCTGVESVTVSPNNESLSCPEGSNAIIYTYDNSLTQGFKCSTIPAGTQSISWGAFYGDTAPNNLVIPKSVTSIGNYAFYNCSELKTVTYLGTEEDWAKVTVGSNNTVITNASIIYQPCQTHQFETVKVTKTATCTAEGKRTIMCTVCGEKETQTIEKKKHTPAVRFYGVEPTCSRNGYTDEIYCTVCKQTLTQSYSLSATSNHTYDSGEVTKAATCTDKGVKTYTCTVCGETKTEDIAATGHKAVTDKAVAPTCAKAGKTAGSHCSVCGTVLKKQTTVAATGKHTMDSGTVTKKATYTATGTKDYKCTVCGKTLKTETLSKLEKKANTLTVTAKTLTVKYSKLENKAQTFKVDKFLEVKKAKGTVTYKITDGNKNITIDKKTGKITIKKKGLKKGKTYNVKIKVTAAGTSSYKKGSKTVTVKIKVK